MVLSAFARDAASRLPAAAAVVCRNWRREKSVFFFMCACFSPEDLCHCKVGAGDADRRFRRFQMRAGLKKSAQDRKVERDSRSSDAAHAPPAEELNRFSSGE